MTKRKAIILTYVLSSFFYGCTTIYEIHIDSETPIRKDTFQNAYEECLRSQGYRPYYEQENKKQIEFWNKFMENRNDVKDIWLTRNPFIIFIEQIDYKWIILIVPDRHKDAFAKNAVLAIEPCLKNKLPKWNIQIKSNTSPDLR